MVLRTDIALFGARIDAVEQDEFVSAISNQPIQRPPMQLRTLNLGKNALGDRFLRNLSEKALPNLPSLHTLCLWTNNIGDDGMISLANALPYVQNMENLFLNNNLFGDIGMTAIAASLPQLPKLRYLSLGSNAFGDVGLIALTKVMPKLKSLESLGIGGSVSFAIVKFKNEFTDAGATAVANALAHMPMLKNLRLQADGVSATSRAMVESKGLPSLVKIEWVEH
jgi:Ran GTPase-activating protein (RanGAP) involved in mRNA processing and transport